MGQDEKSIDLKNLGWGASWQDALAACADALGEPLLVPARVMRQESIGYWLAAEGYETGSILGRLPGRWRRDHPDPTDRPCAGDWLAIMPPAADGHASIRAILPRRSLVVRQAAGHKTGRQSIAANIDRLFITAGLDGDFNPRRIDRMLALAAESGVEASILLNKADIAADAEMAADILRERGITAPVHIISAETGAGLESLAPYLQPGQTLALIGASGVGKSTLVNHLAGENLLETGEVREKDRRGRHTTTQRELILLPSGAIIMDTPGLREIQFWQDEDERPGVTGFDDIEAMAAQCRFRDCKHGNEPGCALQAAVEADLLDAERVEHFIKLEDEARQQAKRQEKAEWRKAARAQKFAKQRRKLDRFGDDGEE